MQIDVDYYSIPAQRNTDPHEVGQHQEKVEADKPVIRIFGVNAQGNSVCAHVHNFTSYFYIHIIEANVTLTAEQIEAFKIQLNRIVNCANAVLEIEIVEKYPILNYQKEKMQFLKVYCSHPSFVARLRSSLEKGLNIAGKDCLSHVTYESNIPYALRFMVDNEFGGMSWLRVNEGKYVLRHESIK